MGHINRRAFYGHPTSFIMNSETFYILGKTAIELANTPERPPIEARAGAHDLLVGAGVEDIVPAYRDVNLADLVQRVGDVLSGLIEKQIISDLTSQISYRVIEITREENPTSRMFSMGTQVDGHVLPDQLRFVETQIRELPEGDDLKYHMYVIVGIVVFVLGMASVLQMLRSRRDRSNSEARALEPGFGLKAGSFHVQ